MIRHFDATVGDVITPLSSAGYDRRRRSLLPARQRPRKDTHDSHRKPRLCRIGRYFRDPVVATALLDSLLHRAVRLPDSRLGLL